MADRPAAGLLRNVSIRNMVRALEHDGFAFTGGQGSQRIYRHADGRRVVHYHRANATLLPYVLRNLLIGTQWTEADLRRFKLARRNGRFRQQIKALCSFDTPNAGVTSA